MPKAAADVQGLTRLKNRVNQPSRGSATGAVTWCFGGELPAGLCRWEGASSPMTSAGQDIPCAALLRKDIPGVQGKETLKSTPAEITRGSFRIPAR